MVCRASRYSSAMVTFARDMTELEDNQVLSINHQLMRESESVNLTSDDADWNGAIQEALGAYRRGELRVEGASRNPEARLTAALSESHDASRVFAGRRLLQRCRDASEYQKQYLEKFARDTGLSLETAKERFRTNFAIASEHSGLHPTPSFVTSFTSNPDNRGISRDRRTLYAIELMEATRLSAIAETRSPIAELTIEIESGRNSESGPIEVRWSANATHIEVDVIDPAEGFRTELYRAESAFVERFKNTNENAEDLLEELRNNTQYHYASNREAQAHRWQHRCASCGQFANINHACPVIGSINSIEYDIARLARAEISNGEVVPQHRTESRQIRSYMAPDGLVNMPAVARLQTDARQFDATEFTVASVTNGHRIDGTVSVIYNGYGNGYSIAAATGEGDAGDRRLRCLCPEYQNRRDCHHISLLQENLVNILNNSAQDNIQEVQEQLPSLAEALQANTSAAEASAREETVSWVEPAQPLSENHELFQEIYKEHREKRAAWLADPENQPFPIQYQRENALGGLSTRENGRGFGIEIEFAFPNEMNSNEAYEGRRRIAQELNDLGLTNSNRVGHYGASHGWVRDEHSRGWAVEEDFSASGRDGQVPGEIISPIMYDEPETWQNIEKICEILKRNGAFASRGAGQHVHVSTGDYDHKVINHNRMLSIVAENEDLLYRLSVDPRRGRHRGYGYCAPNPVASEPYRRITEVRNHQTGHNLGVNFQSISGRPSDHAEFRMFDSSLEPAVIQSQIALSLAVTAAARREVITNVPASHHTPLGSRLEANPGREALSGDAWREQTASIKHFIDKYIPTGGLNAKNAPLARQIVGLFALTKWQRSNRR